MREKTKTRATGIVATALLLAGLVASLVPRRRPVEERFEVPAQILSAPAGLAVDVRRASAHGAGGAFTLDLAAYARNTGDKALVSLGFDLVVRRSDGSEIARRELRPVGSGQPPGWLDPPYGVQLAVPTFLRERPASCELVTTRVRVADGPPGTGQEHWRTLDDLAWDGGPPAGVRLEVRVQGFSIGPEQIIAPRNAAIFDTTVGVKNLGEQAVSGLALSVRFLDAGGQVVDVLALAPPGPLPILPGDAVLFTGGRGVKPYARSELRARLSGL